MGQTNASTEDQIYKSDNQPASGFFAFCSGVRNCHDVETEDRFDDRFLPKEPRRSRLSMPQQRRVYSGLGAQPAQANYSSSRLSQNIKKHGTMKSSAQSE